MSSDISAPIDQFIIEHIDSLEQLEVLLLLAAHPEKGWTVAAVYEQIKSSPTSVTLRLEDLSARGFLEKRGDPALYRFAAAPEIAEVVHTMMREGQVTIHAGWLQELRKTGDHVVSTCLDRHTREIRDIHFDRIVNCTGMEKCSISKVPLLKKMAANGMLAADSQGLGLAVSPRSELLTPGGRSRRNVYAMWPMTVGQFFEIIAVPDIRVQAKKIADKIALSA